MRFFTVLFMVSFLWCNAQTQQLEVGLQLGGSYYSGDMDAPTFSENIKNTNFAFGFLARYHVNTKLAFRGNLTFGKLEGKDSMSDQAWQIERNLSFTNNFTELAGMVEYSLFSFDAAGREGRTFTPYLTAGIAYYKHNPKTTYQGQTVMLQPLGTEGQGIEGFDEKYSLNQISIPFGGGIKFAINDRTVIGMELIGRRTFTDHLDDLSEIYVAYDELRAGNGELSAILSDRTGEVTGVFDPERRSTGDIRGSADVKDYYFSGMVTFSYMFDGNFGGGGGQIGCPTF